jgi:hypothetical protein
MSEKSYQIVVTGELVDGAYLPEVKVKLAALFKMPAAKLDPLFSGKRVVIKRGLGAEAAQQYVAAVRAAGLICGAEETGAEAAPSSEPASVPGVSLAPVGVTLIDPPPVVTPEIDVSAYSVASVGEVLVEPPESLEADIDISALSMDPLGEDLVEHAPPQAPAIDTGDLSVAPAGTQMAEAVKVTPAAIDIGDLDLAPVGSEVGESRREEAPPPPDTSHLELD